MKSKVSIIIPTYNRAHLIGETLDSILTQTYLEWECIVVDDRSTDNSQKLFDTYANKDKRFRFFSRPASKPKGANACRNIGLQEAKGDYIVFFDSDDLMTSDHLEVKINAMKESGCDYVITRTKYFNKDSAQIDKYYNFDKFEITPYNYVVQNINWLTYDVCIKTPLAQSISFNEHLHSGQEYNYFSKLVHHSVRAVFIDKVLTMRRHHDDSIRSGLKTKIDEYQSYFNAYWLTFVDIKEIADTKTKRFLISNCAIFTISCLQFFGISKVRFYKELFAHFGVAAVYHLLYILSMKVFNKGYFFRTLFFNGIEKIKEY